MTNDSNRFFAQGAAAAFAAVIAVAVPAAKYTTVASAPAVTHPASVSPAGNRHALSSHFIGFDAGDSMSTDIRHRWP